MVRQSLSKRPLDAFYAFYLLMHLFPAVLIDSQAYLPKDAVPAFIEPLLAQARQSWLDMSNDPLLGRVGLPENMWFKTFTGCELFLQTPFFAIAPVYLYRDDKRVWLPILLYAVHSATTVLPCLTTIWTARGITEEQFRLLMASYVPYMVVPLLMLVDFYYRLAPLIQIDGSKAKTA